MKLATKDIDNFIKNVPKNIKAILLYGPDSGLVRARSKSLKENREVSSTFNYEDIKNKPELLLDHFNYINLFSSEKEKERMILVECSGSVISKPYIDLLKSSNYKGLLVFTAKELGTDSSLRKFFETNDNVASLPCYQDDQASINKIIQQTLKQYGIDFDYKVIPLLANCIQTGNRDLILSEINKIALFLANKKYINIEDIENYLELQNEVSFDKLCYQLSLKQTQNIEAHLTKLQNEGHNLVSILRILSKHFYRLYQVKKLILENNTEQYSMSTLSPPVFFKQSNDFSKSLKLWNIIELSSFLKKLTDAEFIAKSNPSLAELIIRKIFLELKS